MRNFLMIILVVIVFFGIAFYDTHKRENSFCKEYYNMEINGIVDSVFKDRSKKESPRVFLKGDATSYAIYAYDAWEFVKCGDSLVKDQKSYKFTVYRHGDYPQIFFYTDCDK